MRSSHRRGPSTGLAAAVLFGASTPFAKLLVPGAGPLMLAGLLYVGAAFDAVLAPSHTGVYTPPRASRSS